MNILEAMAKMEGFGASPTNRPTRNNNPGDIEYGKFALAHGAVGNDGGYARFPDVATGYAAMKALLQSTGYAGLTVQAGLDKWCPPPETDPSASASIHTFSIVSNPMTQGNNPSEYVLNVCKWAGLEPTDLLSQALSQV